MTTTTSKASPISKPLRKKVIRVIFISLLLDLISFTFILPLFPKLLEFYLSLETNPAPNTSPTILARILSALNAYKNAFARPISSRYDIVLLGGALGSLFSFLQALASPVIGSLSDTYGRRTALLYSMAGNILSVLLWVLATDFRTFLASRVVGGLSEGNVQLATAIAADISDESERGSTMALVGVCFSVAFTCGPALGAWLAGLEVMSRNPFGTAAGVSLLLIVTETIYLYTSLPETLPTLINSISTSKPEKVVDDAAATSSTSATANGAATTNTHSKASVSQSAPTIPHTRTNTHTLLNLTHLTFILFFSGLEFSLTFLTHDLFGYTSSRNGRLLSYLGLIASLFQGTLTRRLHPLTSIRLGVVSCAFAFFILANLGAGGGEGTSEGWVKMEGEKWLYVAATGLAVTSATVVTGLNGLSSFEAAEGQRGGSLGRHRSWGQLGRAVGPINFCSLYWWAGREVAYAVGGVGMLGVVGVVFGGLRRPRTKSEYVDEVGKQKEKKEL